MSRLLLALLLTLGLASPSGAGQTELQPDAFGGTETNTLPTYNAGWVLGGSALFANCTIRGTPGVGASGVCADYDTRQTWTDDQWGELTADGTNIASAKLLVLLRFTVNGSNQGSGYACGKNTAIGTKYLIGKYTNNTFASLVASTTSTPDVNDVINFQVQVNHLSCVITRSGSTLETITVDDSSFTTGGNPGLAMQHSSALRLAGSWRAGSITADVLVPQSSQGFLGAIIK